MMKTAWSLVLAVTVGSVACASGQGVYRPSDSSARAADLAPPRGGGPRDPNVPRGGEIGDRGQTTPASTGPYQGGEPHRDYYEPPAAIPRGEGPALPPPGAGTGGVPQGGSWGTPGGAPPAGTQTNPGGTPIGSQG